MMAEAARGRRPGLTLGVVSAAMVLVPVTATGAPVVLPDISVTLGTSLASAQWVVNAFFLTFASFMAISGSLADLTGRRRMFAGGITLFCVAMLVAASAPTMGVLVVARVIAGMGAAGVITGGSALIAHAFDGRARTKAFGVFGTAIGFGLAFGPLLAGVIATSLGGWRMFFLLSTLAVVPSLVLALLLPESKDAHPAGPDWPGAVTFTLGLSLFVLGFVEGPALGWGSPLVIGAFVACAGLLVAFVRIERRSTHPLIEVSLFAEPRFMAVCAMPVLLAFGFVAPLVELPEYLMAIYRMNAEQAGLMLVLLTGPTLLAPLVVSSVAHRMSRRLLLVASMVLVAVGAAWLTVVRPDSGVGTWAGPLLVIGTGFGTSLAIMDGAAVSAVAPERAGMAAGVFNTMRLGGESIAVAVFGSLLAGLTQAQLTTRLGADTAKSVTAAVLQGTMPATTDSVRALAADAYTAALHVGMWTVAVISALGAVMVGVLAREPRTPEIRQQVIVGADAGSTETRAGKDVPSS